MGRFSALCCALLLCCAIGSAAEVAARKNITTGGLMLGPVPGGMIHLNWTVVYGTKADPFRPAVAPKSAPHSNDTGNPWVLFNVSLPQSVARWAGIGFVAKPDIKGDSTMKDVDIYVMWQNISSGACYIDDCWATKYDYPYPDTRQTTPNPICKRDVYIEFCNTYSDGILNFQFWRLAKTGDTVCDVEMHDSLVKNVVEWATGPVYDNQFAFHGDHHANMGHFVTIVEQGPPALH